MHDFQTAWAEFQPVSGAKLLKGDDAVLPFSVLHDSWDTVVEQVGGGVLDKDKRFHLSLIPQPFLGDLSKARVVILTLNPGLRPIDYFAEFFNDEYRNALLGTLRQDFDERFPNIKLNPRFSWTSGFRYWHDRLAKLIDRFAEEPKIPRIPRALFLCKIAGDFGTCALSFGILWIAKVRFEVPALRTALPSVCYGDSTASSPIRRGASRCCQTRRHAGNCQSFQT